MNYGTRALGVHVLVLERDETNVSGLAMTFHLLSLIRCCLVRWQQGWGDKGAGILYVSAVDEWVSSWSSC